MSDEQLQRDIALVDDALGWLLPEQAEAWQRIRARLNPDREVVARAICTGIHGTTALYRNYLPVADAAIAAMGETP